MEIYSFLIGLLVILFYGYFFYNFFKKSLALNLEKKFFRAVNSIIENTQYNGACIEQFEIIYKKLREKNPSLSRDMKSALDFLEDMVYYYDTRGEKEFKNRYALVINDQTRARIVTIINEMKTQNPFVSLSREDSNILTDIKHSIETSNIDLGARSLRQLAEEIKIKESNLQIQEKRNSTSIIIAVIGAILTIVFGLIAFLNS